jgi:alginate O-acetyltransferase complex protein AlgI
VLLVIEKLFLGKYLKKLPAALSHIYAITFIVLGWLIFYFKPDFGGFGALSSYFVGMVGGLDIPFINKEFGYTAVRNFALIAILCFACTPFPREFFKNLKEKIKTEKAKNIFTIACDFVLVAMFILCIVYISSSEYRPNIYFEF